MLKKILSFLLVIFLCGCATLTTLNPATGRKELIFINDSMEAAIGKCVARTITQKKKLWNESRAQARVENVGKRIADVSDRSNIEYEFYILDDEQLNAITLPGGIIFINKGLLNKLNDDEVAFILGHEVGHVAARHVVKKIQANMAFQLLLAVAFAATREEKPDNVTKIVKSSKQIYNLIALGYSRQDEYFADKIGVKYAFNAGFDPHAATTALESLKECERSRRKLPEYLRSHPYVDQRIRALRGTIPQLKNTDTSEK